MTRRPPPSERYPKPEHLAPLHPFLERLVDAANEYDAIGDELTTAAEFIDWLRIDVERASYYHNLLGTSQRRAKVAV